MAANWDAQGRPPTLLLEGHGLIALRCWSWSEGARIDGMSEVLQAFLHETSAAQPEGWLEACLSDRGTCGVCGERYKLENLKLCTHCSRTYCYRCASERSMAINGNPACACGGELVG
jgi:hypothetical protein